MKKTIKNVVLSAILLSAVAAQGGVASLSLTPDIGAGIQFSPGGAFQFTTGVGGTLAGGYQWFADNITPASPEYGNEYIGKIDGTFQIGTITAALGYQSAPVTSTGSGFGGAATVTVMDTLGQTLTGTIDFGSIKVGAPGYSATLGVEGTLVVSHITYGGSAVDLGYFQQNGSGSMTIQFQYNPGGDLYALKSGGGSSTSFNGALSTPVVPETSTAVAGVVALGLVLLVARLQRRSGQSA